MEKIWVGCAPTNFSKGRRGFNPDAIVIHIMDGSLTGTDAWFNDRRSNVSAHYGVGRDGKVHQYVAETDTAYHAGIVVNPTWQGLRKSAAGNAINPNYYTIGIEHEGFADEVWPQSQIDASKSLVAEIADRWNIPLDLDHIVAHHSIRASKLCPGPKIDIATQLLNGRIDEHPAPARDVTTVGRVNVRLSQPSTSAPIVGTVPSGSLVKIIDYTDAGERVRGNSAWYKNEDGNYLWAGATNMPNPRAGVPRIASSDQPTFEEVKQEYSDLYKSCVIRREKQHEADALVDRIARQQEEYLKVGRLTGNNPPWYVVAIIHSLECSLNLRQHLHNGDPLDAPTVHVPARRPPGWAPPFEWDRSALDALQYSGLTRWKDWSIEGICFRLEAYNGWGSRRHGINTPYLWSFSQHYTLGKYISDREWSASAVSDQCGGAVLLHALEARGLLR